LSVAMVGDGSERRTSTRAGRRRHCDRCRHRRGNRVS
jgi:hypothetical protein